MNMASSIGEYRAYTCPICMKMMTSFATRRASYEQHLRSERGHSETVIRQGSWECFYCSQKVMNDDGNHTINTLRNHFADGSHKAQRSTVSGIRVTEVPRHSFTPTSTTLNLHADIASDTSLDDIHTRHVDNIAFGVSDDEENNCSSNSDSTYDVDMNSNSDDPHDNIVEWNFNELIASYAGDRKASKRINTYMYLLDTGVSHDAYANKFLNLLALDKRYLHQHVKDLQHSVRSKWKSIITYKIAYFTFAHSRQAIIKVPYMPLLSVAGLICGSPSYFQDVLTFNRKYIHPYVNNLDGRRAELEALSEQSGMEDLGFTPSLMHTLQRTQKFWRRNVEKAAADDIEVLWFLFMKFSDGFSWMGRSSTKNQWSKL